MAERIEASLLADCKAISHGFFTRRGGVSCDLYESLNAGRGSDDNPNFVKENRTRIITTLGAERLATPYQVHGARAVVVDETFDFEAPPKADGLVTDRRGLAVGIVTADCAPVLLADSERGVIAACHAGWRGAATGIIEATVACMESLGARRDNITAALGPMIGQESYEVGPEVRAAFLTIEPFFANFFADGIQADKYWFDLEGAVAGCLAVSGVAMVEPLGRDTYRESGHFYSYRRATHQHHPDYGRQLSAIMLR